MGTSHLYCRIASWLMVHINLNSRYSCSKSHDSIWITLSSLLYMGFGLVYPGCDSDGSPTKSVTLSAYFSEFITHVPRKTVTPTVQRYELVTHCPKHHWSQALQTDDQNTSTYDNSSSFDLIYECVSKSLRTESIAKYTTTTTNTRRVATQRVMAAELTRLTHKIATQLYLVAESCTICSSRSRRPVRKLLDLPSY
jgi:hypothetical protein